MADQLPPNVKLHLFLIIAQNKGPLACDRVHVSTYFSDAFQTSQCIGDDTNILLNKAFDVLEIIRPI